MISKRDFGTKIGLIKEQCYYSMQNEKKIQYSCRRIKIPAGGEKCIEAITDKLMMPHYDREENSAKKMFRDLCDKYMRNQLYHPCEECILIDEHNIKVIKHSKCKAVLQRV